MQDIALVMSHINSYGRKSLNWKSPIELFRLIFEDLADVLFDACGIELIQSPNRTPECLIEARRQRGKSFPFSGL